MDEQFAHFGEAATFTAPPSLPIAVQVIRLRHDPVVSLESIATPVRSPGWEARLRQSEVPSRPRPDLDTLTIGAAVYSIRDVQEDLERTQWTLDI